MKIPKKLSVFYEGKWVFAKISSNSLRKETDNSKFYVIDKPFGILESTESDPKKTLKRGQPGDYLVIDSNNILSVMSKSMFNTLYPKNTTPKKLSGAVSYKNLTNKDFYTEVVRNQPR